MTKKELYLALRICPKKIKISNNLFLTKGELEKGSIYNYLGLNGGVLLYENIGKTGLKHFVATLTDILEANGIEILE